MNCHSEKLGLDMKGLKRKTNAVQRKHAISCQDVMLLLRHADYILPAFTALNFKVMVSLAFYGFLRPFEYCITPANHHLRLGTLRFPKTRDIVT